MYTKEKIKELTKYRQEYEPNVVQQAALPFALLGDGNLLVASGTGTGKSMIYEWAMYRELCRGKDVVVLHPSKALAEQKFENWCNENSSFAPFSKVVRTGDYHDISIKELVTGRIKIFTPEAFAVTLRGRKVKSWVQNIGALIVDEIHTLGMEGRGNGLEACIINFFQSGIQDARFIGVSATIDKSSLLEIRGWLHRLTSNDVHVINAPTWRPTPLYEHFTTYRESKNYHQNESKKMDLTLKKIDSLLENKVERILVFVHSKKTGRTLLDILQTKNIASDFHCADVPLKKRKDMENKFLQKRINVLVATSTLAVGMDFPVEHVIIVGMHRGLNIVEKDTIQQMRGRSGHQVGCREGNVYYFLPVSKKPEEDLEEWKKFITDQHEVKSELGSFVWLAFHVIAVINNHKLISKAGILDWFESTLAFQQKFFENKDLDPKNHIVEQTVSYLTKYQAIVEALPERYETTHLGRTAAYFYFDVKDLFSWKEGLTKANFLVGDDYELQHFLGCALLSESLTLASSFPPENSISFQLPLLQKIKRILARCDSFLERTNMDPVVLFRRNFLFHLTELSGDTFVFRYDLPQAVQAKLWSLNKELQRAIAALKYLSNQDLDLGDEVDILERTILKIVHGVPEPVIDLLKIRGIGRVKALKIFSEGIYTFEGILSAPETIMDVLGKITGSKVLEEVKAMVEQKAVKGTL